MKKIAFFDFDGTVTTQDTMLEMIKFQKGVGDFFAGFLVNSPFLIAYKAKLISNQLAKERVLTHFFKGTPLSTFQLACNNFASAVLPALIRPGAMAEISNLKAAGFEVVIVSASAENWIKRWCEKLNVQMIATRLEVKDNMLTGKLSGKNCHGEEKVTRIKATYDLSAYEEIYCYGDTSGDKPMLALATKAFYKPFRG